MVMETDTKIKNRFMQFQYALAKLVSDVAVFSLFKRAIKLDDHALRALHIRFGKHCNDAFLP